MASNPRNSRIEVLPMRLSDLDSVMEIERLSFQGPWTRQVFIDELEREFAHVDVVHQRVPGGSLAVAFCNYWLVHDEVHILNIACHPDKRRQGHAGRLLEHMIHFARRHRCRQISLEVRRRNQGAHKLYRGYGFRAVGIRPNYYVEDREDAIVMVLDLPE